MAPITRRVCIYAGAPEASLLDWDSDGLLTDLAEPIAQFAPGSLLTPSGRTRKRATTSSDSPGIHLATWRSIPLRPSRIQTGYSQTGHLDLYGPGPVSSRRAEFFVSPGVTVSFDNTASSEECDNLTPGQTADISLAQSFYDHSVARHDDLPSSQLPVPEAVESSAATTTSSSELESFQTEAADDSLGTVPRSPLVGHFRWTTNQAQQHLSDLEDIPNAAYLRAIAPATMSAHLIVAIMSLPLPKTVNTRWGERRLVEVLVSDETRSNFTMTVWLNRDAGAHNPATASCMLDGLRPQDIVLFENVGLNVFNNKVYGSSLRKNTTRAHLLHRKKIDASDKGGHYTATDLRLHRKGHPQLQKTWRVREWMLNFVGYGKGIDTARKRLKVSWQNTPAFDTQ